MKVSRLFTIDVEIAEKLAKMDNQSGYVNEMLKEYMQLSPKKMNVLEQKKAICDQFKSKIKQIRKEIKLYSEIEELSLDYQSIKWLKNLFRPPALFEIEEYIDRRGLRNTAEEYLKAWKLIKDNESIFEKY